MKANYIVRFHGKQIEARIYGGFSMGNNYMKDNSSQVVEDIKWILFDDRDYDSFTQFETWVGDGHSFIIRDEDGQEYRVTVTREEI